MTFFTTKTNNVQNPTKCSKIQKQAEMGFLSLSCMYSHLKICSLFLIKMYIIVVNAVKNLLELCLLEFTRASHTMWNNDADLVSNDHCRK